MHTLWSRMLLLFIYVRRWRLSCIVAVYCKYSFTMGSPWPFLSRIRYPAVSSTRSYIVNLASPPIFIPHPNQHTNRISLSYTLAYAIYCGQMMHIDDLGLPLSGLLYDNLYAKSEPGWHVGGGLRVFGFGRPGTDFLRSHSQRSCKGRYGPHLHCDLTFNFPPPHF